MSMPRGPRLVVVRGGHAVLDEPREDVADADWPASYPNRPGMIPSSTTPHMPGHDPLVRPEDHVAGARCP